MMAPGLVLIGCGAAKQAEAAPAAELYTGSYFRLCLAAALAIAEPARVRILSARYGLLGLADLIEPYDVTLGDPGAITSRQLGDQAAALGLLGQPVTALCGARYADLAREVWADVRAPLAGLGIGWQRHALARIRDGGEVKRAA